jgi:hypothetical protein
VGSLAPQVNAQFSTTFSGVNECICTVLNAVSICRTEQVRPKSPNTLASGNAVNALE